VGTDWICQDVKISTAMDFFGWSLLGSMSPLSGRSPFSQLQRVNDVALLLLKIKKDQQKATAKD